MSAALKLLSITRRSPVALPPSIHIHCRNLGTAVSATDDNHDRFTLGYWKLAARAAPARMMLEYAGVQYKNVMYEQVGAPFDDSEEKNDWQDVKFKMDLDFPNIPYLIDHRNNLRITQTFAIWAYLGRELGIHLYILCDLYCSMEFWEIKHHGLHHYLFITGIGPQSGTGLVYNDMVTGFLWDNLFYRWYMLTYTNWPQGKEQYYEKALPPELQNLENWLRNENGSKRTYFGGDSIAVCDFLAYYVLFCHLKLEPNAMDKTTYPELNRFYDAFTSMPFMDTYRAKGYEDLPVGSKGFYLENERAQKWMAKQAQSK